MSALAGGGLGNRAVPVAEGLAAIVGGRDGRGRTA